MAEEGLSPALREAFEKVFPLLRDKVGLESDRKFEAITMTPWLTEETGDQVYKLFEDGIWRFDAAEEGSTFITSDIPLRIVQFTRDDNAVRFTFFNMPLTDTLRLSGMCGVAYVRWSPLVGQN